jgi:hypothetical protein
MRKYEARLAAARAKLAKEEESIAREGKLCEAFLAAGYPEPDFLCLHDLHATVKYKKEHYGEKHNLVEALSIARAFESRIVPMDPAKDGFSRSIFPACARRNPDKWVSDGVEYAVNLRQHEFGESSGSHYPQYHDDSLSFWARVGEHVVHVQIDVSGVKPEHRARVTWNGRSNSKLLPPIPHAKLVSYGGGTPVSLDANYLFASIDDAEQVLLGEVKPCP